MFGKLFGKKAAQAGAEVRKFVNKDLMEATIAAAFLVAGADGEVETAEMDKLEKVVRNTPEFADMMPEVNAYISKTKQLVQDGGMVAARQRLLREVKDVKTSAQEAEDVFAVAATIALSDGTVEPQERKVLEQIATVLNINRSDYPEIFEAA